MKARSRKKATKKSALFGADVGDEVRVRFYDHAGASESLGEYFVYGRLSGVNDISIVVDSWANVDAKNPHRKQGDEIESFCLVRGAITEIVQLATIKAG